MVIYKCGDFSFSMYEKPKCQRKKKNKRIATSVDSDS